MAGRTIPSWSANHDDEPASLSALPTQYSSLTFCALSPSDLVVAALYSSHRVLVVVTVPSHQLKSITQTTFVRHSLTNPRAWAAAADPHLTARSDTNYLPIPSTEQCNKARYTREQTLNIVTLTMAPSIAVDFHHPQHHRLLTRAQDPNNPPLASVFALVIDRARALSARGMSAVSKSISSRNVAKAAAPVGKLSIAKRQQQILVIPTTYANLNDGPDPGAVVGITIGAILGFLLLFFLMLFIFRAASGGRGGGDVVEEDIIRRHHTARSRSTRKRSPTASSMSEVPLPPEPVVESRRSSRREARTSRRTSRQTRREPEEVIVEEAMSEEPDAVVVEEEEDDVVEVIEEHSPEPPPRRKKSGYRTVDPAEYGGGDAPSRRVGRR